MDVVSQAQGVVKPLLEDQTRVSPLVEEEEEEVEGTLAATTIEEEEEGTLAVEAIEEEAILAVEVVGVYRMTNEHKSRELHDLPPSKSAATELTILSWPPPLKKGSSPSRDRS